MGPDDVRATLLLCDYAVVAEGKLYISGAGWTEISANGACAIAMLFHVPWTRTNQEIEFSLKLLRQDGNQVEQIGPLGPAPVEVAGKFEVGRPPGLQHGVHIDVPIAASIANIAALAIDAGERYEWRLYVDDKEVGEEYRLPFNVRKSATTPSV